MGLCSHAGGRFPCLHARDRLPLAVQKPTTPKATTKKAAAPEKEAVVTKKPTTPKATTNKAAAPEITQEMIAERAYHISQSGEGGTDEENWHRAEAELR
jgi:hypothetical protein